MFYAETAVFRRVFASMMVKVATVYATHGHARDTANAVYEPINWDALLESDLSGVKWRVVAARDARSFAFSPRPSRDSRR